MLGATLLAAAASGQTTLPVNVEVTADTSALPTTGVTMLAVRVTCDQPLDRAFAVRIELRRGGKRIVQRDHAPPLPSKQWAKGTPVEYSLPFAFRMPPAGVAAGDLIEVWLGFLDESIEDDDRRVVGPSSPRSGRGGMARVADFRFPDLGPPPDAAAVDATIAAALATKDAVAAWDRLEFAFRRLDDYPLKAKLQKALLTVGKAPPAPPTFEELGIVEKRIQAERERYLRIVAGRMNDRGRRHGAIMLLDEVGGALQVDADRAVLGALADARRATKDRDAVAAKLFEPTKEQQEEAAALAAKMPPDETRIEAALRMAKDPARRAVGRALAGTLESKPDFRDRSRRAVAEIEKEWLADVPPDERAEAAAAMNHPCWSRTATRASHRFLIIGPKAMIDDIPADSLLRFDVAYLYLTDLFGRLPNPNGDRVTVYWKELFEFGGGIGGGKTIDIGNADPTAKGTRTDTGLLYHELTHCVDDTAPVYGGFREGIADFGAVFASMELGQVGAARASIGLQIRAFHQDYLDRDLEYWRIPNYAPSAGFFAHFLTTYGKSGDGYRWELWRKFFRDYRDSPVKDARTPMLARSFAFHLTEAFGDAAFADLIRFRWPLEPSDLDAIRREQRAAKDRSNTAPLLDAPGSPVPRDRIGKRLADADAGGREHATELGIVREWRVIGPFRKEGVDPDLYRFPPELEIDFAARYDSIFNRPAWRVPGERPITVERSGWLHFDFPYMDDSAIYALTHVTVDRDVEAWFWLRADDDVTLFVDDELLGKHDFATGELGPWRPDWRVHLPDAVRFRAPLTKGRHKVLVKVKNRGGTAGLSVAIATANGLPLEGLSYDAETAAKKPSGVEVPDPKRWPQRFRASFEQGGTQKKLDTVVGKWRVRNGALEGFAYEKEVEWRKYTVRPGFPKDSPSNLAWLPEKVTEHLDSFALTLQLPAGAEAPKAAVIVQGDGARDALSGWTLLLEPDGKQLRAHLERYELRVYTSAPFEFEADPKKPTTLELTYFQKRLSVRLGKTMVFDQAPLLPIPGKTRIGIVTWNDRLRIEEIELRAPARSKS